MLRPSLLSVRTHSPALSAIPKIEVLARTSPRPPKFKSTRGRLLQTSSLLSPHKWPRVCWECLCRTCLPLWQIGRVAIQLTPKMVCSLRRSSRALSIMPALTPKETLWSPPRLTALPDSPPLVNRSAARRTRPHSIVWRVQTRPLSRSSSLPSTTSWWRPRRSPSGRSLTLLRCRSLASSRAFQMCTTRPSSGPPTSCSSRRARSSSPSRTPSP
mmetsp:Transcript_20253/g.27378  ORF Transcript_20253/g.27378 Transcript_20253/m.27378 type:complete len:214 (+) Transcript_20253:626-1267(+)